MKNLLNNKATIAGAMTGIFIAFVIAFFGGAFDQTIEYTSTNDRAGAAGTEIPTVVALFETSLSSAISSSATSMTLTSATDKDGNALASSTYPFIIDEGTASEELVLADCTGTACTNMIRGVSVLTGTSTVSALKKSHRRGASVKITDGPQLMILSRMLNGVGDLPNIIHYGSSPVFTSATQIVDKNYVDNLTNQGAATSSESIAGISELATALETASSTQFDSDNPHVINSEMATDTPSQSTASGTKVIVSLIGGYMAQGWINLTEAFTWTGNHIFNTGTVTFNNTVDIEGDAAAKLTINTVAYEWPSSSGSANTVLTNNGSDLLTWSPIGASELATSTADNLTTTTSTATSTLLSISIPADTLGTTGFVRVKLYFSSYKIRGSSVAMRWNVAYGSQELYFTHINAETGDGSTAGTLEILLMADDFDNVQEILAVLDTRQVGLVQDDNITDFNMSQFNSSALTVDSTSAQTLTITASNSESHAGTGFIMDSMTVEYIK